MIPLVTVYKKYSLSGQKILTALFFTSIRTSSTGPLHSPSSVQLSGFSKVKRSVEA
jgi:hypothetical protein